MCYLKNLTAKLLNPAIKLNWIKKIVVWGEVQLWKSYPIQNCLIILSDIYCKINNARWICFMIWICGILISFLGLVVYIKEKGKHEVYKGAGNLGGKI